MRAGSVPATVVARSIPGRGRELWPFPDLALLRLDHELVHPCALLDGNDPLGTEECAAWGHSRRETGRDPVGSPASFVFKGVEGDGFLKLS